MSSNEIKSYYEAVFEKHGYESYRPKRAYRSYLDVLPIDTGRLLDIGCGTGHLLKLAEERGFEPYGIDISEEAIRLCREYVDGTFECAGGETIPFENNQFDVITCIGVLEHTLRPENVLQEVRRVAKPEATFLFVVPNKNFVVWRFIGEGTEQQAAKEHLRDWEEWKALFQDGGYSIETVRRDPWHEKLIWPASSLAGVLNRLIPLRSNYQFAVEMTKA
jgi:2-polyprenyl-3-methyl-5-hydroxy-6-metoxy-1,4-benzoquinol methylase